MHVAELLRLAGAVGRPEPAEATTVHLLLQSVARIGVEYVQILFAVNICSLLVPLAAVAGDHRADTHLGGVVTAILTVTDGGHHRIGVLDAATVCGVPA